MLRFLIGAVIGFALAAIVLPEDLRLREPLYKAWLTTRVFVTELLSGVDQAAEEASEATERATEEQPLPAAPDAPPAGDPETAPAR